MNDVRLTIQEIISKWQGVVSIADAPAIALLTLQRHPGLSASLGEHLVRTEIIDRALAARLSAKN